MFIEHWGMYICHVSFRSITRAIIPTRSRISFTATRCLQTSTPHEWPVDRIRNIGIIAHIDAGKTTTTERMLYYSGHTRRIGDVDEGSTITDFLPAERARGITIQSAAISFMWPPSNPEAEHDLKLPRSAYPHHVNLIDTPGHADFTFEVRRSLRVLDGAVCILDGVAGVEAQTEQVWKQAGEWQIPRIAYVNKLDREGAAFGRTVREIGTKLGVWPVVCQIPWWEAQSGRFCGVADIVNLQALLYEQGSDGKHITCFSLDELHNVDPPLAEEIKHARIAMVELLSEHDDILVEDFLAVEGDHLKVCAGALLDSLRRCLLKPQPDIVPVFAGASFRNIGVQPLLDGICNLLPSPQERPVPEITLDPLQGSMQDILQGKLTKECLETREASEKRKVALTPHNLASSSLKGCALAFKVVHDPKKGMLVYIRVYHGSIDRNALLFNTNLQVSERATTLLRMYANESVPVDRIEAGQVGVIAGSKTARTGDTLVSYSSNKAVPPEPLDQILLRPIRIPPPVFFASLEPNSLREEKDMHEKLAILLREDPSLHVSQDQDTGQTLISGMGELHLEIARDRLVDELRANATMGKIAIGYRETLTTTSGPVSIIFDRDRSGSKGRAGCTARVESLLDDRLDKAADDIEFEHDGNVVVVEAPSLDRKGKSVDDDHLSLPNHLNLADVEKALANGASAALTKGPLLSYPMRGIRVILTFSPDDHTFGTETNYGALTAAARLATISALRDASSNGGSAMMEPIMNVEITVDDASLGSIVQDISSTRGGHIVSLADDEMESDPTLPVIDPQKIYAPPDPYEFASFSDGTLSVNLQRTVKAKVPLKEMVGYLKHLRSMTGGRGTFVMNFDQFVKMTVVREKALLAELRGQS